MAASLELIADFLSRKRVAMVGISRDRKSFSVKLAVELRCRGYDVVPVNPTATEMLGQRCFARVQQINPPVEAALLLTSPKATEAVVADCAAAGIGSVWMYRAGGRGAVSPKAVQFCHEHGIRVIPGECPLMFLPDTAGIHRFHGFLRKITGRYPQRALVRIARL